MSECQFQKCKAECCRYISVFIDTPRSNADFDEIKWFTAHENVTVYKDHEKQWIVEFSTPCIYIEKGNTCRMYGSHPDVCSAYKPETCTFNTKGVVWDKIRFTCPDDVEDFLEKRRKKRKKKAAEKIKTAKNKTAGKSKQLKKK